MPNVLLFRPIYDARSRSTPAFPWALLYLASVLVQRGIDVDIVDETCTPDCAERVEALLKAKRPIAVGITSMTGEQIRHGLGFARQVRASSNAAIVWGGIHPSLLPEQTVQHPLADYVVAGEGEYAFADLVECLARNGDPGDIPGVFMKRGNGVHGQRPETFVDLAALPEIPFDLIDVERYICRRPDLGAERYFEVCTSRGCPHHCGFCYIESVHGSQWRPMAAEAAVDHVKNIVKRFHVDAILFREDNFFVQRKRAEAIAQRLIDENVNVKWAASCRINYFTRYSPEFIELLRRSGCVLLTFGVESGSNRVLEFIRKDITLPMIQEAARKMKQSGIRGTYHFMGGFPSETEPEFLLTCRLIDTLMKIAPETVVREMSIFAPYPGVGLIPECTKRGYVEPDTLDAWVGMDWSNPSRPWLTQNQSRLISDAQFLIARLNHPNPVFRAWIRLRWRQLLHSRQGITLFERPALEALKRRLR